MHKTAIILCNQCCGVGVIRKVAFLNDFEPKDEYLPKPQTAHVDYRVTGKDRFLRVLITAIKPASILVWLGSHVLIRAIPKVHKWDSTEGFTEGRSTEASDEYMACMAHHLRKPTRIMLGEGQTLVMDGYLVHAGDMPEKLGAFRLHRYLMDEGTPLEAVENTAGADTPTFTLNALNIDLYYKKLKAMFWDPREHS